ncbi:hypothetical protein Tco_0126850 [Tanacetum coccineum]
MDKMAIRNFVYAENEEDLSFFPKEPSPDFGTSSPSVSVNIEPLMTNEEPVLVVARMKNRKHKTMGGLSKPLVKRKLAPGSSTARAKTFASKEYVSFLTISDEDEGKLPSFEFVFIVFATSGAYLMFCFPFLFCMPL